jgi:hypothetical protein
MPEIGDEVERVLPHTAEKASVDFIYESAKSQTDAKVLFVSNR